MRRTALALLLALPIVGLGAVPALAQDAKPPVKTAPAKKAPAKDEAAKDGA